MKKLTLAMLMAAISTSAQAQTYNERIDQMQYYRQQQQIQQTQEYQRQQQIAAQQAARQQAYEQLVEQRRLQRLQ